MIGRVSERILKEGRDIILSQALMSIPQDMAESLKEGDVDVRESLENLLDYLMADFEGDIAGEILENVISGISDRNMPWTSLSGLVRTLGLSVIKYVAGRSGDMETALLYHELIEAQARVFGSYLENEKGKLDRLGKYQREFDRFPDTIAATLDPPTLAKVGLAKLKGLVGAREGTLCVVDSERRITPQFGDHASGSWESTPLKLDGEAARLLIEKGEPYWEDTIHGNSCLKGIRDCFDLDCILLLPLVVRGRTTGIVLLSDGPEKRRFTTEEIEIAASFAIRLAVAMENARLHAREQYKIKETVALLEIARAVNSTLDLKEILDKVVQMTVDLCGVVMCVVYVLEEGQGRFFPGAHYGFIEDAMWEKERASGFTLSSIGNELPAMLSRGEPATLTSGNEKHLISPDIMREYGVNLVLMFPLSSKDRITGLLALFYPRESSELEREEIEVVGAIAAQASLAIENATLYEDIERSYFSTVKALAKAIEVKDPYTHGHSERVTEYALIIAEAMQLNERDKQKLKYAATLHDIGKIGIAGRVLNKPEALTEEEYMHVKTHPRLGDTIVEPVEFLQGPRPIILHHHERYDGKGYPDGLKGPGIPLCARILSVADAFEAMRSDRPYRRALPLEVAKSELIKNSGTQFDPEVVKNFLEILERRKGDPVNR